MWYIWKKKIRFHIWYVYQEIGTSKRWLLIKLFEYTAAVRGYHYFKTIWQPKENVCQFDNGNSYDMFVIKTCDQRGTMVGHLPSEVSIITKFLTDRGATVSVMLTGTHYRRSPLVRGGLKIPCKASASMRETCLNLLLF